MKKFSALLAVLVVVGVLALAAMTDLPATAENGTATLVGSGEVLPDHAQPPFQKRVLLGSRDLCDICRVCCCPTCVTQQP